MFIASIYIVSSHNFAKKYVLRSAFEDKTHLKLYLHKLIFKTTLD